MPPALQLLGHPRKTKRNDVLLKYNKISHISPEENAFLKQAGKIQGCFPSSPGADSDVSLDTSEYKPRYIEGTRAMPTAWVLLPPSQTSQAARGLLFFWILFLRVHSETLPLISKKAALRYFVIKKCSNTFGVLPILRGK